MARHYSTRTFFRQIPNNLLARYFERPGTVWGFGFLQVMEETRPEELFTAWLKLPEESAQRDGRRVSGDLCDELREGSVGYFRRGPLAVAG